MQSRPSRPSKSRFSRPWLSQPWLLFPTLLLRGGILLPLLGLSLSVLIVLSGLAGRVLDAPEYTSITGDCPQPCWMGLRPGFTTENEALELIRKEGLAIGVLPDSVELARLSNYTWQTSFTPRYTVTIRFANGVLDRLDLFPQDALRLEAVFTALGPPSHARLCRFGTAFSSTLFSSLFFAEGLIEVQAQRALQSTPGAITPEAQNWFLRPLRTSGQDWQVSPDSTVTRLTYRAGLLDLAGLGPMGALPWAGFGRVQEMGYCQ